MTVAHIRGDPLYDQQTCEFWTRESSLELPPRWQHRPVPGIDTGSAAVSHALTVVRGWVIVIGADGVCGGDTETLYHNHYVWHGRGSKKGIHQRHRQSLLELNQRWPGRLKIVTDRPQEGLDTLSVTAVSSLLDKYRDEAPIDGKTRNRRENSQGLGPDLH
jgi:hypothetical protein